MKTTKWRGCSLVLAVVMMVLLLPGAAAAELQTEDSENIFSVFEEMDDFYNAFCEEDNGSQQDGYKAFTIGAWTAQHFPNRDQYLEQDGFTFTFPAAEFDALANQLFELERSFRQQVIAEQDNLMRYLADTQEYQVLLGFGDGGDWHKELQGYRDNGNDTYLLYLQDVSLGLSSKEELLEYYSDAAEEDIRYRNGIFYLLGDGYATMLVEYTGEGHVKILAHQVVSGIPASEDMITRQPEAGDRIFADIPENAYYLDAVNWAVENQVTNGTTPITFGPERTCTRGQMVTFLWRAAGEPEPTSTTHPFTDIPEDAYYLDAVLWAVENGITDGVTATQFKPESTVTRAQTVTFLWRTAGKPEPQGTASGFEDVEDGIWYSKAVNWAVENEITNGATATQFKPDSFCTRAQTVTFLWRQMGKEA